MFCQIYKAVKTHGKSKHRVLTYVRLKENEMLKSRRRRKIFYVFLQKCRFLGGNVQKFCQICEAVKNRPAAGFTA